MARKRVFKTNFTTNMDTNLLERFRDYCSVNNLYQNEVIEKLVQGLLAKEAVGANKEGADNDDINSSR